MTHLTSKTRCRPKGQPHKENCRQIKEIQKALGEAERGEFASEQQVKRVAKKWAGRARRALAKRRTKNGEAN